MGVKELPKFNCAVCGEVFFLLQNRILHMEQCHPEEYKTFKEQSLNCKLCDFNGETLNAMRNHKLRHHSDHQDKKTNRKTSKRVKTCHYCSAPCEDFSEHTKSCEVFQSMVQNHQEKDQIKFSYS